MMLYLGYYTFGHELAHNFGCNHDPRTSTNVYYRYGHGHLIAGGFRTIMAYSAPYHRLRVNYYSNPRVRLAVNSVITGLEDIADNARVIRDNRWSMASLGNERAKCREDTFAGQSILQQFQ